MTEKTECLHVCLVGSDSRDGKYRCEKCGEYIQYDMGKPTPQTRPIDDDEILKMDHDLMILRNTTASLRDRLHFFHANKITPTDTDILTMLHFANETLNMLQVR